jgi:hypothetical protein
MMDRVIKRAFWKDGRRHNIRSSLMETVPLPVISLSLCGDIGM